MTNLSTVSDTRRGSTDSPTVNFRGKKTNKNERVAASQRPIRDRLCFLIKVPVPIFPEFHTHLQLFPKRAALSIGPGFKSMSSATGSRGRADQPPGSRSSRRSPNCPERNRIREAGGGRENGSGCFADAAVASRSEAPSRAHETCNRSSERARGLQTTPSVRSWVPGSRPDRRRPPFSPPPHPQIGPHAVLPAGGDPRPERSFCQRRWKGRGDLRSSGAARLPRRHAAQRSAGHEPPAPRTRPTSGSAWTEPSAGFEARRGRLGLSLRPHRNSQPSAGPASQLDERRAASDRDAGWGRPQPPQTYHGPAGNKASTFTPSHTYTAQPARDSREQNKEKTRGPGERPLFWGPIGGRGGRGWGGRLRGACRGSPGVHARRRRRGAGARARARPGKGPARGPSRRPRTWL